jgi:hypothetical protein
MAEEKQNLDGKTPIKPTPFDAHEQATRGTHVETTVDSPDKEEVEEYPKAVDHVDKPGAPEGHKEPVLVNSAKEEAEYLDKKSNEAAGEAEEE